VAAAVPLLETHGSDGLTLRQVAAAVGVTHAAAYRHFDDKTALLAAIAESGFRDLAARLARGVAAANDDAPAKMRVFAHTYVEFGLERPAVYGVMFGPRLNQSGRFPSLEQAIGEVVMIIVAEIKKGQLAGAIRPGRKRDIALSIWVFAHGYVELVNRERVKVKSASVAQSYLDTLFEPVMRGLLTVDTPDTAARV
jgi:AcrR family transcriptional regulator